MYFTTLVHMILRTVLTFWHMRECEIMVTIRMNAPERPTLPSPFVLAR
jgi:hypothetical protein